MSFTHNAYAFNSDVCGRKGPRPASLLTGLVRKVRRAAAALEAGFTIAWALAPLAIGLAAALGAFVAL